jgi:protein SCO1/2
VTRRRDLRPIAGTVIAVVASVASAVWATDGFRAVTLDGARAAAVARRPVPVPHVTATAPDGAVRPVLADAGHPAPRAAIVDFVSTQCVAVCLAQGAVFQRLQQAVQARGLSDRIRLLTVSFDPDDDVGRLAGFAESRRLDPAVWTVVRVDESGRDAMLAAFGIRVVRDPLAGWRHNTALHVVDADGRLVRILPLDVGGGARAVEAALDTALAATRPPRRA